MTLCDCSNIYDSRYPLIELNLGYQYTFYLQGSDYLVFDSGSNKCFLMLYEDTSGIQFWLGGDPFLRAYLAVFDIDN